MQITTRKHALVAASVTCLSLALVKLYPTPNPPSTFTAPALISGLTDTTTVSAAEQLSGASKTDAKQSFFKVIGSQFHSHWDAKLANPYARLRMMTGLRDLFKQKFGENWRTELQAFLQAEFPEWYAELDKKLIALEDYESWLQDLKPKMQFSSQQDRNQAIWNKRLELFGEEAYQIWEAELKSEQMQAKLSEIDNSAGNFGEKSEQYVQSMRAIYGDQVTAPNQPHTTQMMAQFLQLNGVQNELRNLPAEQQYQQLRQFRSAMGLDEQALQRWDALDQERAAYRSTGNQYMQQREKLAQQYQGSELSSHLIELRKSLFNQEEAAILEKEESAGYLRFNSPQVIGQN